MGRAKKAIARLVRLPPERGYSVVYQAPLEGLASVQLSTAQGTDDKNIHLLAELRGGEGILFDPKSGTEVTVWFDRARLRLKSLGCHIEPGSRFAERKAPPTPIKVRAQTSEQKTEWKGKISAHVDADSSDGIGSSGGSMGLQTTHHKSHIRKTSEKQKLGGEPRIIAGDNFWEFATVAQDSTRPDTETRIHMYIAVTEQLCVLSIHPNAQNVRAEATVNVFPSNLQTRVKVRKARDALELAKLSLNQQRIVNLLVAKGCGQLTEDGLTVARSTIQRVKTSSESSQ